MQDFLFQHADNETYMARSYTGDDEVIQVPASYYGCPVSVLMDDLFKGHKEIREVILPGTLTDIGGFVFDGCENLKQISLPDSLHTFWQYAFVRSSFEELVIPEGVTIIPPFCFKDCHSLAKITLLADNVKIMGRAFENCINLNEAEIQGNPQIHPMSFKNCKKVRITVK